VGWVPNDRMSFACDWLIAYPQRRWVGQLFFESTVKGCFVRINIGSHDGHPIYRIVEVGAASDVEALTGLAQESVTDNCKPCLVAAGCRPCAVQLKGLYV
jgi:RNA polymerase-associated protein RTF1